MFVQLGYENVALDTVDLYPPGDPYRTPDRSDLADDEARASAVLQELDLGAWETAARSPEEVASEPDPLAVRAGAPRQAVSEPELEAECRGVLARVVYVECLGAALPASAAELRPPPVEVDPFLGGRYRRARSRCRGLWSARWTRLRRQFLELGEGPGLAW
ncbi:hypothetical protein [Streptomyces sp. NBC_00687]|uniref:hypothetical protein n=1 Tax=Streptomyces sp. NBC_00687 TaxID=2975807 RepID=UPI00225024F2|nr:hypothetical protein [Streptomyces sp. NBC_00687]MCX4920104.1 hypothetical protein [Streptomyces sp. NBC_00687]